MYTVDGDNDKEAAGPGISGIAEVDEVTWSKTSSYRQLSIQQH